MLERRYFPLFLTTFMIAGGYGFIYALLAVIRNDFGISEAGVGAIGATGFAAGFLAQISLSRYADRGHTKTMLRAGLGFVLLGNLGMVFASDLAGFVASRAFLGLGAGMFSPAVRRLVILADPPRAGERLGLMSAFDMAGFVAGPALATLLYELFGLRMAFAALVVLVAALIVPVLRVPFDDAPVDATPSDTPRKSPVRDLLSLASIRGVLFCTLAFYTTVGVFEAIWSIFLDDLGASQRYIGLSLTIFALPMLVFPVYGGRLAQRIGPLRVAAHSIGFAIPCMAMYAGMTDLYVLILLVLMHSIADAFTMPSLQLGIAQASPPEHLGSAQGLLGASGQAVGAVTALGAGIVYGTGGAGLLFLGSAALMTVLLGVGLWQGGALMHPPKEEPSGSPDPA